MVVNIFPGNMPDMSSASVPQPEPMALMRPIRFRFAAAKGLAALHWMAARSAGIDLHTALKACYFADKQHLNLYGQPIFGATYRAMKFGPVPLELYEMAKGEAIWLAELGMDAYPWRLVGYHLHPLANWHPDLSIFSEANREALEDGLSRSEGMTFTDRTAATHGRDWQAAELGIMRYEDMFDETPDRQDRIDHLRETSLFIRL